MAPPPLPGEAATSAHVGGGAPPPPQLRRELLFFILKFLEESNLDATALRLETESGFFFNMSRFRSFAFARNWDGAEWYLSRFTNPRANPQSTRLFFEIRRIKHLEALRWNDRTTGERILENGLTPFEHANPDLFKDLSRDHEELKSFGDVKSWRVRCFEELKRLIETNPTFEGKMEFPKIDLSPVHALINQW